MGYNMREPQKSITPVVEELLPRNGLSVLSLYVLGDDVNAAFHAPAHSQREIVPGCS